MFSIYSTAKIPWCPVDGNVHFVTAYSGVATARQVLTKASVESDAKRFLFEGTLAVDYAYVPNALRALADTKPTFSTYTALDPHSKHQDIVAQLIIRSTELKYAEQISFAQSMVPHFPVANRPFAAFERFFVDLKARYLEAVETCQMYRNLLERVRRDSGARAGVERIIDEAVPGGHYEPSEFSDGYADVSSPYQGSAAGSVGASASPSYLAAAGLLQHPSRAEQSPDPLALATPVKFPPSSGAQITFSPQYSVPRTSFPSTSPAIPRPSGTHCSSPPVHDGSSPPVAGPSKPRVPFPQLPRSRSRKTLNGLLLSVTPLAT
jgi:hypothetical protein